MEKRIEQEINKTLECMNKGFDIQISPLFTEELISRIADVRISRRVGYRNLFFYPIIIALMMLLNFAALMINVSKQDNIDESAGNQVTVIASEYGIGQSGYMNF